MKISVVIPTYNRHNTLRQCLTALQQQDYTNYEIVVVDDGSTDKTPQIMAREFPEVRYVVQETNQGPAAARNRGIRESTGEIIAFTDDDCLPPPDFLSRLADGYRRYPEVAGVGGFLEAADEVVATNIFAQYEAYVTHQVYGAGSQPYVGGFDCPAGGTNSMSYRQDVLAAAGGFDETFPLAAGEDADLKWRIVEAGHQLLYLPVKVIHLQPYTWHSCWHKFRTHGRGVPYFEQKYRGKLPSPGRLMLRGGVRVARWGPDLFKLGPRLATVKLLAELADVVGQWQETRQMHHFRY